MQWGLLSVLCFAQEIRQSSLNAVTTDNLRVNIQNRSTILDLIFKGSQICCKNYGNLSAIDYLQVCLPRQKAPFVVTCGLIFRCKPTARSTIAQWVRQHSPNLITWDLQQTSFRCLVFSVSSLFSALSIYSNAVSTGLKRWDKISASHHMIPTDNPRSPLALCLNFWDKYLRIHPLNNSLNNAISHQSKKTRFSVSYHSIIKA
jgi:hypothetical protein